MNIKILRGSKQIGGSCVELTANNGDKILIDIGVPLDVDHPTAECLPNIDTNHLLGIIISHPHADHYGLANFLDNEIPYYMGEVTKNLMEVTKVRPFSPVHIGGYLEDKKTFNIGPFTITPYLVDHSAYDAYSLLVECDGKTLLYSGDFRAHGRKATLFDRNLRLLPKNVDVMMMEGSCLGRDSNEQYEREEDLEPKFVDAFKNTKGIVAISTSLQNIDRIVTIYKACKKADRQLVLSWYGGYILWKLDNPNVPSFTFPDVKKLKKDASKGHEINTGAILASPEKYVVVLDKDTLNPLQKVGVFGPDSTHIYSMWNGYKEKDNMAKRLAYFEKCGARMEADIHTSGHADIPTLKKFVEKLKPKTLLPIHTFYPEQFKDLFGSMTQVKLVDDDVCFDMDKGD